MQYLLDIAPKLVDYHRDSVGRRRARALAPAEPRGARRDLRERGRGD